MLIFLQTVAVKQAVLKSSGRVVNDSLDDNKSCLRQSSVFGDATNSQIGSAISMFLSSVRKKVKYLVFLLKFSSHNL